MNRCEIEKFLEKNDSSVLSFPNRNNEWGDQKYRGNCSGWIQAFLIWKYQVKKMAELFSGSGTGYDVCKDMGIQYVGADLNPVPVRPGILNVNAITDEVPDQFRTADMMFFHPPYGAEIRIPYAGSMWNDPNGELSKSDLGQMPWEQFMKTLNNIVMKYFAAMESGARMSVLMGDVRRNGLHSMLCDIVKPGNLEQVIIKMQHNTMSEGRTYQKRNFVPLVHEYIMVLKKIAPYMIDFQLPQKHELDVRDSQSATWKDVVYAAMKQNGYSESSLNKIYSEIEGHKKCKTNPDHWKDKVRQVLQQLAEAGLVQNVSTGVWVMAA